MILLENKWDDYLTQTFITGIGETLLMVLITLGIGGLLGMVLGVTLYGTRQGGLLANRPVYSVLSSIVNVIRPIPFIIFLVLCKPLTMAVMNGHYIGTIPATFPMVIVCTVATSRIVEQSLIATDPGIVEAARAMGASRLHILFRILVPEALAPLILGYTFLFVGVLDLSAVAGAVSAGGLGQFALSDGYRRFNDWVVWAACLVMIILVQSMQWLGNVLAKWVLRKR
ncbi:MAG: ABC transporter permease [Propionibacteriaceae bacterium]|jgi:D-methionine transport system permease protein|nr:ABC transporter permease [Propionibacteriaceae bacterium]